jgi:transposase-like protein
MKPIKPTGGDYSIDEQRAIELRAIGVAERHLWPDGPVCPHCGSGERIYRITGRSARPGLRKCGACRKQFTVRVGTLFEGSHIPLWKWLIAIYMMCSYPQGVTASQVQRSLDISYKSAWSLCQRIRYAMGQEPLASRLAGRPAPDET